MSDKQLCKDYGGEINAGDSHFFFAECVGILKAKLSAPIDALLFCPQCGEQHVDEAKPDVCETCGHRKEKHNHNGCDWSRERGGGTSGKLRTIESCHCETFTEWLNPPHKSHRCGSCNHVWRPADAPTNGVLVLKSKGDRDGNPRPRYFLSAKAYEDSVAEATAQLSVEVDDLKKQVVNAESMLGAAEERAGIHKDMAVNFARFIFKTNYSHFKFNLEWATPRTEFGAFVVAYLAGLKLIEKHSTEDSYKWIAKA